MKKNLGVNLSILTFLTIISTSFVSANTFFLENLLWTLRDTLWVLVRFFSDIILDINSFDEFLFIRILLFVIIYTVIQQVLERGNMISDDSKINTIISICISLIAIRFLDQDMIAAIILPYTALGAGITIFIPFAIFFFFLHEGEFGPFGRRFGWAVYLISLTAIYMFGDDVFSNPTVGYMYIAGALFAILSLIFDKNIHKWFAMREFNSARREMFEHQRTKDLKDYNEVMELLERDPDSKFLQRRKRKIEKRIKRHTKRL